MTEKGQKLLADADVNLVDVNVEKAAAENGQLNRPSGKPAQRDEFFTAIKSGANYDRLVLKIFPKQSVRQIIKGVAIKMKLYKPRGGYSIVCKEKDQEVGFDEDFNSNNIVERREDN
jgi:hypothetical protein